MPHAPSEKKQALLKDRRIPKIKRDIQLDLAVRGRRDAWEGDMFSRLSDPSAPTAPLPKAARSSRERGESTVYLLLCSLLTQEKELF